MGGGESLTIGLGHPELFAWVAGFSAALRPDSFATTFAKLPSNRELKLLWIGCGTDDSLFAASKSFSEFLDAHGVKHIFHDSPGAHTWMVWRHYLNELAQQLFR
jgi:enterochelin esterase family protein